MLAENIPEGQGQAGTTYCAPIGSLCGRKKGKGIKISSEQDWYAISTRLMIFSTVANTSFFSRQGSSHNALYARLLRQIAAQDKNLLHNGGFKVGATVQFYLKFGDDPTRELARIYYYDYDKKKDDHSVISPSNSRRSIEKDLPHNLSKSLSEFYGRP
jgi:hypothetical protein